MAQESGVSTVEEIERTPAGKVRRWTSEIDTADKKAREWRDEVQKVWDLYRSKRPADNTFNIFWSNVETLRPALYNSSPRPDVRRRFRDPDPVGKVAANVMERTLTYSVDKADFDFRMQMTVLDVNIVGRGLSRVKYEPVFSQVEGEGPAVEAEDWLTLPEEKRAAAEPDEEVVDESTPVEHVSWNKWLHGEAKKWGELPWMSFEHDMQYDQLCQYFGEDIAKAVPLSEVSANESGIVDKDVRSAQRSAKVYEIWDKRTRSVLFICHGYKAGPLLEVSDPLKLQGFWPMPRAVYAIEDSETLEPAIPYVKYKQQAQELNRVTRRINKVVDALKVRGAYSGSLSEVSKIIEATDNQMIAIENASEIAAMGGLDKAIWIMPIDKLIQVLKELYASRAQTIQSIYEITGLGDVMRGVSNPHETLGAQKIKSQWGTLRLQRLQREIQRFIRDLLRLEAEIIGEHFQWETLSQITGIKLLTEAQKKEIQQRMAQAQMGLMGQPAQQAPQLPPDLAALMEQPSVEEVMALLKGDALRQYRIDIETDSTVAETVSEDTQGMQEVLTAITNLFTAAGPAIQQGLISVDVVKSLAQSICRRAKAGQAVEDAIDQIKQPPPQQGGDPAEVAKKMGEQQQALQKATADVQTAQAKVQQLQTQAAQHAIEKSQIQSSQQIKDQQAAATRDIEQKQQAAQAELQTATEQLRRIQEQIKDATHALELKGADLQVAAAGIGAQKSELSAAGAKHQADVKSSLTDIREAGVGVMDKAVSAKGEQVAAREQDAEEAESKTAAGLQQLESIVEKLASTVEKIAEMQADTNSQINELQKTVTKPKVHTAVKKDGKWTIQST